MKSYSTLFLALLSFSSFAQDSSFQLKDYKYRTPGYQALAFSFDLSGSYNEAKDGNTATSGNRQVSIGPAYVYYTKVMSTGTRLHQSGFSLRPQASFSGTTYNEKKAQTNNFTPAVSWYLNDRFYRKNNWFFELGNQLSAGYAAQHHKDSLYHFKNKGFDIQDNLILGVGKGRIENVQDAQMALYILQDLSAQQLLSRTPTGDEARSFAQLITAINNRRVFDSRRRRIYELTMLDSFLRSTGLAPQTDIRHFTTVNDNWALAFNPARFSGSNWYLRLQPGIRYQRNTSTDFAPTFFTTKATGTSLNLTPVAGYENDHPINLRWQRNLGVSLAYVLTKNKNNNEYTLQGSTSQTNITTNYWNGSVYAFYGIGYFPNNRTQIFGTVDVRGDYYKNKDFVLLSSLLFDAKHFISYRTYLTASAYAQYEKRTVHSNAALIKRRNFSSGLSVSVSHIIF